MSLIVLLDAGPLGMVTNPKSSPDTEACKDWLANLVSKGVEVVIPEIADYEVRRELLRAGKDRGLGRLDALKGMRLRKRPQPMRSQRWLLVERMFPSTSIHRCSSQFGV